MEKQIQILHSILRVNAQLDLNNPRLRNMKINAKLKIIDSVSVDGSWTQIFLTKQLQPKGNYTIKLLIQQLIDRGQIMFGQVTEELCQKYAGSWSNQESVFLNRGDLNISFIYTNGKYVSANTSILQGSNIIMLIVQNQSKVKWYLNEINKIAERSLNKKKIYEFTVIQKDHQANYLSIIFSHIYLYQFQ